MPHFQFETKGEPAVGTPWTQPRKKYCAGLLEGAYIEDTWELKGNVWVRLMKIGGSTPARERSRS
jgi:hypothetical protein